jgi:hypothetical protein
MIRHPKPASDKKEFPHGFLLSEAAQYAFLCQEVFPDIISFAAAIPDHLKPLFLIPIKVEMVQVASKRIASRVAMRRRLADGAMPDGTGGGDEGEWFGTKTFKYDDNEPTVPKSDPGSIFDTKDGEADSLTHHQEYFHDENIEVPTDTSYMNDVDITQYWDYPYRTKEKPIRHSFQHVALLELPWRRRLSMKPDELEPRAPTKIKRNAQSCRVALTSYDKKTRVFTFSVECGHQPRTVQASLSDVDKVALSCDCPFWRYNGPEFHATQNAYMLGQPFGLATPPNVRDPDRKYFLCKHAYSVLKRLDDFVQEVTDENWDADDEEILEKVDEDWDRLEGEADIPIEDLEDDDLDIEIDWEAEPEGIEPEAAVDKLEEEEEVPEEEEYPEYDVDLSELEPDYEAPKDDAAYESDDYQAVADALSEDEEPEVEYEVQVEEEEPDYEVQPEEEPEAETEEDYEVKPEDEEESEEEEEPESEEEEEEEQQD